MSEDRIVAGITALIGLAAMAFGMSQDTVSTLQQAVPQVVGGAMAIASVVTYLVNRRKAKEAVFYASVSPASEAEAVARNPEAIVAKAKEIGLI